jgi:hypothetical protein
MAIDIRYRGRRPFQSAKLAQNKGYGIEQVRHLAKAVNALW